MNEVKDFTAEKARVVQYLSLHTATASQVSVALQIWRPNMCRHKSQLQDAGLLIELHKDKCPITNFKATFLTCNPSLIEQYRRHLPQLSFPL